MFPDLSFSPQPNLAWFWPALLLTAGFAMYAQTAPVNPAGVDAGASPGPTSPASQTQNSTNALVINLKDAMQRARKYSPQFLTAEVAGQLAHDDRVQAKAALLPGVNYLNQFIYTQPNGTPSGIFVSNDGPHVYNSWATVHGEIYAPAKIADYRATVAAEAAARARTEVAARGLIATVYQAYYTLASSQRKLSNAAQGVREAQDFVGITQKQEQGGEAAHSDVIKAEIQLEQRRRDSQEAQLALEKSRVELAVLLFPDFRQDYSVVDNLESNPPLPSFNEVEQLAEKKNPDIRAAEATVRQQMYGVSSARASLLPSLSFDYFFGINANQVALYNPEHQNNLGSAAQAQLNIPIWTWGAARSRVRQAKLRLQLAKLDLTFTQRQLLANLNSFYQEASVAHDEVGSLRHSLDLSSQSLKLVLLRYQAGESTVLEVVDAQTTLTQARNAFDDGLVRYQLALANLQTLTGVF
jgi:outer membrane protein TolC